MLEKLGLERYLHDFRGFGFGSWETLSKITETELERVNMRLGDRRKLQRAIARSKNWPDDKPLPTAWQLNQHTPGSKSSPRKARDALRLQTSGIEVEDEMMSASSGYIDFALLELETPKTPQHRGLDEVGKRRVSNCIC